MQLLRDITSDGFPTDYVIARVRARRASLTLESQAVLARKAPPSTSDEVIWDGLLAEYAWLYEQADTRMRVHLAPVLALFELKTLVLCLRNIDAGRKEEVDRLTSMPDGRRKSTVCCGTACLQSASSGRCARQATCTRRSPRLPRRRRRFSARWPVPTTRAV